MTKVLGVKALEKRLARIPQQVRVATKEALRQNAEELTAAQKRMAPVKSGDLRRSIGYTFGAYKPANSNVRGVTASTKGAHPDLSVTVHAGDEKAFYAAFVEFGTAAHTINAKNKPALHLYGNRFAESVEHPGAGHRPFFYPPYRSMKKRMKGRITRAMKKAVRASVAK